MKIHILGFPRIGLKRELKFKIEIFWKSKKFNDEINLIKIKDNICKYNWNLQKYFDLDYINFGDFSYYDNILNTLLYFNCIPNRFKFNLKNLSLKEYFELSRGNEKNVPMEMTKWFNTNYHYLVPEYKYETKFNLGLNWIYDEIKKIKFLNNSIKFFLIGPLSLLKLGKIKDNKLKNKLFLLPDLLIFYINFIKNLNYYKVDLIQIDEPCLNSNISNLWFDCFKNIYLLLNSYFSNIILINCNNLNFYKFLKKIPFKIIHVDLNILNFVDLNYNEISIGLIDGKNIWNNNIEISFYLIKKNFKNLKNLYISPNNTFFNLPINLNFELKNNVKNWLSFTVQKLKELKILKDIFNKEFKYLSKDFIKNLFNIEDRKKSKLVYKYNLQKLFKNLDKNKFYYRKNYILRKNEQKINLKLNLLPTTTIGSFPQTSKIRKLRLNFKKNLINKDIYIKYIKKEIYYIIKKQIDYKIDVFVHGEPERNDMVEYFSEYMSGILKTENGWVQSYGTRCVKPPIIYGDINVKNYITLNWIKYSKSLTKNHLKGMLTGPITMLKWSFIRNDQPNYLTSLNFSIFIKKEVLKLELNKINIIQIDEPALIECLPLKKIYYNLYFNWSLKIFLFSFNSVLLKTQIHTHICYSDMKNILKYIKNIDIDVISIETARSNMEILPFFINYKNDIGLGIYDIHSKIKLNINYSIYLIKLIILFLNKNNVWINPDCGLKTRNWKEVNKSLLNMVYSKNIIKSFLF